MAGIIVVVVPEESNIRKKRVLLPPPVKLSAEIDPRFDDAGPSDDGTYLLLQLC